MPQAPRSARLETRTGRAKLAAGTRIAVKIGPGLHLFYRRGAQGAGTWQARRWTGSAYVFQALGLADDARPADGAEVFGYFDACEKARTWAQECARPAAAAAIAPLGTVGELLDWYLLDFIAQRKRGVGTVRSAIARTIKPELGALRLDQLTAEHMSEWLQACANRGRALRARKGEKAPRHMPAPTDEDGIRARRATVNRTFSVLRAALNLAFEKGRIASDDAWRRVRPFGKVDQPRIRFLTAAESTKLVNACPPDLRALVRAGLLTGARFGELAAARVGDFETHTRQLYLARTKNGRPRRVPLNPEGVALFDTLTKDRGTAAVLLTRADGSHWGPGDYRRALEAACTVAKIAPPIKFHELRHTFASLLAQAGCDLLTISKLLGHADTRVTARHYAHLCDKSLSTAVGNLPAFTGTAAPEPPTAPEPPPAPANVVELAPVPAVTAANVVPMTPARRRRQA